MPETPRGRVLQSRYWDTGWLYSAAIYVFSVRAPTRQSSTRLILIELSTPHCPPNLLPLPAGQQNSPQPPSPAQPRTTSNPSRIAPHLPTHRRSGIQSQLHVSMRIFIPTRSRGQLARRQEEACTQQKRKPGPGLPPENVDIGKATTEYQ